MPRHILHMGGSFHMVLSFVSFRYQHGSAFTSRTTDNEIKLAWIETASCACFSICRFDFSSRRRRYDFSFFASYVFIARLFENRQQRNRFESMSIVTHTHFSIQWNLMAKKEMCGGGGDGVKQTATLALRCRLPLTSVSVFLFVFVVKAIERNGTLTWAAEHWVSEKCCILFYIHILHIASRHRCSPCAVAVKHVGGRTTAS